MKKNKTCQSEKNIKNGKTFLTFCYQLMIGGATWKRKEGKRNWVEKGLGHYPKKKK